MHQIALYICPNCPWRSWGKPDEGVPSHVGTQGPHSVMTLVVIDVSVDPLGKELAAAFLAEHSLEGTTEDTDTTCPFEHIAAGPCLLKDGHKGDHYGRKDDVEFRWP